MSGAQILKELVRPPFANYDVVVYFGCGLFVLPFFQHYILSLHGIPAMFDFGIVDPLVNGIITALAVLFSVYIAGHIIAYVASITVEKAIDNFFGKTSAVVLASAEHGTENSTYRRLLMEGYENSKKKGRRAAAVFRAFIHVPAWPAYVVTILTGTFGYYRSRVPNSVIELVRKRFPSLGLSADDVSKEEKWFKPLEAVVMNTNSVATARMYNYLIISGLFRSLCCIFLASLWFEFVYLLWSWFGSGAPEGLLMLGVPGFWGQLMSFAAVSLVYSFCLYSFLKFQRRYVEDAIFAFAFTNG